MVSKMKKCKKCGEMLPLVEETGECLSCLEVKLQTTKKHKKH